MPAPCPPGQTRDSKTKLCRDKKKPGRKAGETRKKSKNSKSSVSSNTSDVSKVSKLYGSTFQVLTVKFAEDRIKDKKPVIGIQAQDWENGDNTNMKVFRFIGFGEDSSTHRKDLSPILTEDNLTLHYMCDGVVYWAYPANNSANVKTDDLCFGSGCDPIFVVNP